MSSTSTRPTVPGSGPAWTAVRRRGSTDSGVAAKVDFVTRRSLDYLAQGGARFDFIFLDGDHSAGTVYREVSVSLQRLNKNGTILLHDYYPDRRPLFSDGHVLYGPVLAMERIQREQPAVRVVPLGRLPWETRPKSHATSLALLTRRAVGG